MIRLQRRDNGLYFAAFTLHILDMHSFLHVGEFVRICPRYPAVSIKPMFRYRTPKSDKLLDKMLPPKTSAYGKLKQRDS